MLKNFTRLGLNSTRIYFQINNKIRNNYYTNLKSNILFILPRCYTMSGEAASFKSIEENEKFQGMPLHNIVKVLTEFAPLALAESWDNVGLLIEPFTRKDVKSIMLTNDLAKCVLEECVKKEIDMIISYHPPIFSPIKKLNHKTWAEKVIQCCLENRIAVYSPHTTWDSVPGGISDWLASAFDVMESEPLQHYFTFNPPDHIYSVIVIYRHENADIAKQLVGLGVNSTYIQKQPVSYEFVGSCKKSSLPNVYSFLKSQSDVSFEIYNRVPAPEPNTGIGRLCTFQPITVKEAVRRIKKHTDVNYARVAYANGAGPDTLIKSAAIVPGSGSKVLANVKADLYVTGEMLHHDILAAVNNNSTVIMTTHSDSERGFLKVFAKILNTKLNNAVKIFVSETDKDPVIFVS